MHWLPLRQPGLTVGPVLLDAAPVLAVRIGYPLAERGWATLEDLGDAGGPGRRWRTWATLEDLGDDVVLDAEGVLPAETVDELVPRLTPAGRPVRRRFREGRMAEVLSLVARGQVVHPTVDSVGDHYCHPGVVLVPLRDAPWRWVALVWVTARTTPALRAFVAAFTDDRLADGVTRTDDQTVRAARAVTAPGEDPATGSPPW